MSINQEDNLTIEEVLEICKTIKEENIEVDVNPLTRPKNATFMYKYHLKREDVRQLIRELTSDDYVEGPIEDNNPNYKHPFWVFIKYIDRIAVKVYIKIKIFNHKRKINVFSIHEEGEYD